MTEFKKSLVKDIKYYHEILNFDLNEIQEEIELSRKEIDDIIRSEEYNNIEINPEEKKYNDPYAPNPESKVPHVCLSCGQVREEKNAAIYEKRFEAEWPLWWCSNEECRGSGIGSSIWSLNRLRTYQKAQYPFLNNINIQEIAKIIGKHEIEERMEPPSELDQCPKCEEKGVNIAVMLNGKRYVECQKCNSYILIDNEETLENKEETSN